MNYEVFYWRCLGIFQPSVESSNTGFCSHGAIDILDQIIHCCAGLSVHGRCLAASLAPINLMVVAPSLQVVTTKISGDIAKCILRGKIAPIENYYSNVWGQPFSWSQVVSLHFCTDQCAAESLRVSFWRCLQFSLCLPLTSVFLCPVTSSHISCFQLRESAWLLSRFLLSTVQPGHFPRQ